MQCMTCCVTCHFDVLDFLHWSDNSHDIPIFPKSTKDTLVSCQEKTRRGPKELTKSLLVKLHLRKGDPVRVTTPPAPIGTRYDVDLDHPDLCASEQGKTS